MSKELCLLVAAVLLPFAAASADPLDDVLAAQADAVKARYDARHPAETLRFFGIEPGMTVIEAFPGGGWYSNILSAYLGNDGRLIGADYAVDMYPKFNFYDDAFLEAKHTWAETWPTEVRAWHGDAGAAVDAFHFGSMPESLAGKADAVLLIRAMHNLARFREDGYLAAALADIRRALKPGGIVGVVQHRAPDGNSDTWANGSNGYLKKQFVIDTLTGAGFELVGESDINANPADKPSEDEFVWRLPPSFYGFGDDAALKAKYAEIGESNRMTLLFRKPE